MGSTFQKSMVWLHTWSGVVICSLLFAVFWTGTLSVFDREIDRWMMPATRLRLPPSPVSLDRVVAEAERLAGDSSQWSVTLPSERAPMLRLAWRDSKGENVNRYFDAASGTPLPDADTYGGTGFIYPFHYRLHIRFMEIGYWLVGCAAMAMLVGLVSGVVIHQKLFREFFTFRPAQHAQRAALDLHNLTGVLFLPFHFVIAFSGLAILFTTYFPSGWHAAYDGNRQAFSSDVSGVFKRKMANAPGPLASLDGMVREAQRLWGGGNPSQVRIYYPGDANSYVEVRRSLDDRVTMDTETVYFDAKTAAVLGRPHLRPVKATLEFVEGLHRIQFRHWTLRWLYFLAGLAGCFVIATGFVVWLEGRRLRHAQKGLIGVRVVEALAVSSVVGILIATAAFFIANRLLPLGATLAGVERPTLEMWAFYIAWLITLAHAAWRGRAAWAEQSGALSALAVVAAVLNWATTGDHLIRAVTARMWSVAGVDAMLLVTAILAAWSAQRLRKRVWKPVPQATSEALSARASAGYA